VIPDRRVVAVIPARMASSRFPGKPLARILDLPMIEHVRRRALLADGIDEVVVATCDGEILEAVHRQGGQAVMTADTHERCTDRVEEAMRAAVADVVVIVQGDEPLLLPEAVSIVAAPLLADPELPCTSLLSPLESNDDFHNPNIVKAVCTVRGDVMMFSRGPIPYFRHKEPCPVFRQTGILAFQAAFLSRYASLPETPFERVESVDLLRLLEHGVRVAGVPLDYSTIGVDRPEDVPLVEEVLRRDPRQKALHEQITES
jgi:3-deoxy-manno-octulosonate cytidylyltransferase (CMP-KDO synthetase)